MAMQIIESIHRSAIAVSDRELPAILHQADVVGVGGTVHGAHEIAEWKVQLVDALTTTGFRAIAFDTTVAAGMTLDAAVTGDDEVHDDALLAAGPHLATVETLELLRHIQKFNRAHPHDLVRVFGVNISDLGETDSILTPAVAGNPRAEALLTAVHAADPEEALGSARELRDLLTAGPLSATIHHYVEMIVDACELRAGVWVDSVSDPHQMAHLERWFARRILWWHETTGQRVIFYSSNTHIANAAARTVHFPPAPGRTHRAAGNILQSTFGERYVAVGLTFGRGEVDSLSADAARFVVPAISSAFAESALDRADIDGALLVLRDTPDPALRAWLQQQSRIRVIGPTYDPATDADHCMTGGSLGEWFDVIAHIQQVSPVHRLDTATPA